MRSTRVNKKKNKKIYIRNILLAFFVIIPSAAFISANVINMAVYKDKSLDKPVAFFKPTNHTVEAFKYNIDINSKELYRVEIKKYEKYEEAENRVTELKKKKLNAFIIKEQGYLVAYGIYTNKSQADTAAKYLKRKNIDSIVNSVSVNGVKIKYDDLDITLIDLATAVDDAAMRIINEKSALSLESLYSDKLISEEGLKAVLEQERNLDKYLNYLKDIKTSEANKAYKTNLEELIKELLGDRLQSDDNFDYYNLQNSLMKQAEALRKFYIKFKV